MCISIAAYSSCILLPHPIPHADTRSQELRTDIRHRDVRVPATAPSAYGKELTGHVP